MWSRHVSQPLYYSTTSNNDRTRLIIALTTTRLAPDIPSRTSGEDVAHQIGASVTKDKTRVYRTASRTWSTPLKRQFLAYHCAASALKYRQEIDWEKFSDRQLRNAWAVVRGFWAHARAPTYPCLFVSFGHHRLTLSFHRATMSTVPSTSTSQSNFASIFNAALESYKRKTKKDLASHPLLPGLQSCASPEAILSVLREQVPAFNQSQNRDDGLTKWVTPTVNVLYTFSATIGQGVGLVSIEIFRHEKCLL